MSLYYSMFSFSIFRKLFFRRKRQNPSDSMDRLACASADTLDATTNCSLDDDDDDDDDDSLLPPLLYPLVDPWALTVVPHICSRLIAIHHFTIYQCLFFCHQGC
jgi:hypothetical protein